MKTKAMAVSIIVILSLLFSIGTLTNAQEKVLTPEIILTIKTITEVQLSPSGKTIVFQISRPRKDDEKPGGAIAEIWKISSQGGNPVRFTYNEKGDRSSQFSPDGKSVAFLSTRGESDKTQIYIMPVDGGEAVQLTKTDNSIGSFKWSPDGSKIAYTMTEPKTKDEQQAEKEGKDWSVVDQNYKHSRLYTIDVKSRDARLITKSLLTVHDFDWSPDGSQFILAATETPLIDDSYMRVKLITVSSEGGEAKLLVKTEGKLTSPRWSPDGKWITWLGATSMNDPFAGSIFIVPSGGGTPENLQKGYEGSATWLSWQKGTPSTIIFAAIERQATVLRMISVPERKQLALHTQPLIMGSPSFTSDGKWMALVANTSKHPNEIFFGEAVDKPLKKLTNFNPQLNDLQLGGQEIIKWKAKDGWDIEGVIVKPIGYEKGKRYPLVMQPHGGPEAADVNGWYGSYSRWGQMLAGKGYVTFYPNYRGSIGRGVQFSKADHRDLMGKEFQDMLDGIDYLVKEEIVDGERVGVGGGSYGGYTSAWAATYGSRYFKAAIAWMGITNWYSMTGTSDIFWENSTVHWDTLMYEAPDLYWNRSPIAHIKNANTPTLIIHGAVDPRVPIGQSHELYTAMKWKGVPVEFVTYPREGHGVSEKAHQLDFMQRTFHWFEKYLKRGTIIP